MSTKKIGNLFIGVSAGTGNTGKVFKGVANQTTGLAAKLNGIGSMAGSAFGGIAAAITPARVAMIGIGTAAAGVATTFAAAKFMIGKAFAQFEGIDNLAKTSDMLGMSTEALAGFQHAADQSGAGDKLVSGLKTMNKRIGEAVRGSGAAKPALEMLGLDARSLANAGTERSFTMIAEAVSKIKNPMLRASLASDIFSKQNMKLVNMLALGADGLSKMQAEAAKLGITLSRQQAAGVEQAQDAMDRFSKSIKGVWWQLSAAIGPSTAAIYKGLTDALTGIGPAIGKAKPQIEAFITGAIAGFQSLVKSVLSVTRYILQLTKLTMGGGTGQLVKWTTGIDVSAGLDAAISAVEKFQAKVGSSDWSVAFSNNLASIEQAMKRAGATTGKLSEEFLQMREKAREARAELVKTFEGQAKALRESLETPLEKARKKIVEIQRLWRGGFITGAEARAGIGNVQADYWRPQMEKRKAEQERIAADIKSKMESRRAAADAIRESVKTPYQKLQDQIAHIRGLWKSGDLSFGVADAAIRKERMAFMNGMKKPAAGRGGTAVSAVAGGSQAFASALAAAWNRKRNPELTELKKMGTEIKGLRRDLARDRGDKFLNLAGV